ncbi:MAG: hypothetical protein GY932_08285 [Arcobacter sp.]|nr:hypothetical protein [Arcobacter sp.]
MKKATELTEEYKAEITDILSKISSGLGKSVIDLLEPKIKNISSDSTKNANEIKLISENNKEFYGDISRRVESLENKTDDANNVHSALLRSIDSNSKSSENKLIEVIDSTNQANAKIEKTKKTIDSLIKENSEIIISNNKTTAESILSEIANISNRITKLENVKTLELQIIETMNRQQKTNKLIFI